MRYLFVAAAVAALAACGNGDDDKSADSCADLVTIAGMDYLGTGDVVGTAGGPQVSAEFGPAVKPACDDGGSENGVNSERETGTAYTLVGIDKRWAIAFGSGPADATIYVVNGGDIPPDVQTKLKPAH
jgi:hypothetical protein